MNNVDTPMNAVDLISHLYYYMIQST